MTESVYLDTQPFYAWFADHYIPNLPLARPVVVLIDSHDSHLDLETLLPAENSEIYLFALLKNPAHLVQLAAVGLLGSTNKSWCKSVREFAQLNPNGQISKRIFCLVNS